MYLVNTCLIFCLFWPFVLGIVSFMQVETRREIGQQWAGLCKIGSDEEEVTKIVPCPCAMVKTLRCTARVLWRNKSLPSVMWLGARCGKQFCKVW